MQAFAMAVDVASAQSLVKASNIRQGKAVVGIGHGLRHLDDGGRIYVVVSLLA